MVWDCSATVVPVSVPSVTTSLVGGVAARPPAGRLLALLRGRLALRLLRPARVPPGPALSDARTEQIASDDLHGHDHEQPQYGQETQPHDREGQL
ncbi:hypothetical protein GCM10020295_41230 [Streptomyces cinereospinus]